MPASRPIATDAMAPMTIFIVVMVMVLLFCELQPTPIDRMLRTIPKNGSDERQDVRSLCIIIGSDRILATDRIAAALDFGLRFHVVTPTTGGAHCGGQTGTE